MKKHPYYKFDKVLSYNAKLNFVAGGRGIGKTYGAKRMAIREAIKSGNQFIYLRRYKSEISAARATFLDDIVHEFPEYDFRVAGSVVEMSHVSERDEKKRPWTIICYFIALSTAQTQKSVAFPKVTLIIFDEFIIEKGALHYLPNEVTVFLNFYSTVDRWQDKTRVLLLANAVTIMNPYFIEYGIEPDKAGREVVTKANGFIAAHFPDSDAFSASVYNTEFGKFIQGTSYADYSVGNVFSDNHDMLLEGKSPEAKYQFTLETSKGTFSVWYDQADAEFYIQKKLPRNQLMFTMLAERMDKNKVLMTLSDRPLSNLRTAFRQGRVSFDIPATRNVFAEVFKR